MYADPSSGHLYRSASEFVPSYSGHQWTTQHRRHNLGQWISSRRQLCPWSPHILNNPVYCNAEESRGKHTALSDTWGCYEWFRETITDYWLVTIESQLLYRSRRHWSSSCSVQWNPKYNSCLVFDMTSDVTCNHWWLVTCCRCNDYWLVTSDVPVLYRSRRH